MAKNRIYEHGKQISVAVPVGTVSGDPVVLGQMPAVALIDRDANGSASVDTGGVYDLPVKGVDGVPANVAIAAGDIIYYNAAATPKLNKNNAGVRFGYALKAVASGATDTIRVKVGY